MFLGALKRFLMKNHKFDVLSDSFNCFTSHFLEASAGTGKTFAIEHTVAKFLSSHQMLELKDILVVTFTKSATADLKTRIFEKLRELSKQESDFQKMCHLKKALARFEEAEIFTIHRFCMQCLKEFAPLAGITLDFKFEDTLEVSKEKKLVKDYLLYKLHLDDFSLAQIEALQSKCKDKENELIEKCANWVKKGRKIKPQLTFTEIYELLLQKINTIKNYEKLPSEFIENQNCFKEIFDRKKQIKPQHINEVEAFTQFLLQDKQSKESFDKLLYQSNPIVDLQIKQVPSTATVLSKVCQEIVPLVKLAKNFESLLARVVDGCIKLKNSIDEVDFWSPDDLLRVMQKSLDNPLFLKKIKEKYKVAIIDEFQDTDPIQWDIFKRCFVEDPNIICYLVGDPKQSIYSFRSADIYTYLEAKNTLKKAIKASLTTNYRSTKPLVDALNTIFSNPNWMPLPKLNTSLLVEAVDAKKEAHIFEDNIHPLHFFLTEDHSKKDLDNILFSYIAKEIISLKKQQFNFSDIAILVKDRFQEESLVEYLKSKGIDTICKKGVLLVKSKGFLSVVKLFKALAYPLDEGKATNCLIDPLFGYFLSDLENRDIKNMLPAFNQDEPIASFLDLVVSERFKELLVKDEGLKFVREIRQTVELILEHVEAKATPKDVDEFLEHALIEHGEKIVAFEDSEAVSVMTMHSSKGLEFEVVFALGIIKTTDNLDELIEEGEYLVPFDKSLEASKTFIEERDAEKARQLYVTFTRAKKRLYVPYVFKKEKTKTKEGSLTPIELFFKYQGVTQDSIIEKIQEWQKTSSISYEVLQGPREVSYFLRTDNLIDLKQPLSASIIKKYEKINSYTALAAHVSKPAMPIEKDFPSSSEVGILLHEIFEKDAFSKEALQNILWGTVLHDYLFEIQTLVDLTLNCKLEGLYGTIILKEINQNKRLKEVEFLIDSKEAGGFLTGFIDLIIEHNGRYYIIDWKSNALHDYSLESLDQEMQNQSYILQESIYRDALKKYLNNFDERPFEECFGGSFYIFLRGLKSGGGVWYKP